MRVLTLKLSLSNSVKESEKQMKLINAINKPHERVEVKLSANKIVGERDRKDNRLFSSLETRVVYNVGKNGCIILRAKIACVYNGSFTGELYVFRVDHSEDTVFADLPGHKIALKLSNQEADNNDSVRSFITELAETKGFLYNMSQFDEFMDTFKYYKTLTENLNSNGNFQCVGERKKYNFIPKEFEIESDILRLLEPMYDADGIIIGYDVPKRNINSLPNYVQRKIVKAQMISIKKTDESYKKIVKSSDTFHMSNESNVNERNSKNLVSINVRAKFIEKDNIKILFDACDQDYRFLNIYDMGQKIKVESIENSLKLIEQGSTSSALKLIEYLIGDEKMPTVASRNNAVKNKYCDGLNDSQKEAFLKAIDGSPVTLIKGPPGTGKTHVINAIVQYITKELKEKVVISSQTHVAIDNVLDKLMENNDAIVPRRITQKVNKYSGSEINKTLYETWAKKINKHLELLSEKGLATKVLKDLSKFDGDEAIAFSETTNEDDYSVIGATTTTTAISGKRGTDLLAKYKWLIIDEVSKCPITEVIRYLPYVENIILVGDDYQLAPLLEFSKEDVKHLECYDEDKFEKLEQTYQQSVFAKTIKKADQSGRLVMLDKNYRSLKPILDTYNIFYDGKLGNMRENVSTQVVKLSEKSNLHNKNVAFVDVQGGMEKQDDRTKSRFNLAEVHATAHILNDLLDNTLNKKELSISTIFPYADQLKRFKKEYKDLINRTKIDFKSFDIDTVDAFQGKETDIVLVNTVVTDESKGNFLKEFRRINVSLSRARDLLIIFGNKTTLSKIEMNTPDGGKRKYFKEIIDSVISNNGMITYKESEGVKRYESEIKSEIEL